MFTGLVTRIGQLAELRQEAGHSVLAVSYDTPWDEPLVIGESVAVEGVCLTVVSFDDRSFQCNALDETLSLTNIPSHRAGDDLNLERAVRAGDRLGGHIVTGHVDGTGAVKSITTNKRDRAIQIACSEELIRGIVQKGSITCNGVSLTVTAVDASSFTVKVIPHTWTVTTLGGLRSGDHVNLETDMIGKYVQRYMEAGQGSVGSLTMEHLRSAGIIE